MVNPHPAGHLASTSADRKHVAHGLLVAKFIVIDLGVVPRNLQVWTIARTLKRVPGEPRVTGPRRDGVFSRGVPEFESLDDNMRRWLDNIEAVRAVDFHAADRFGGYGDRLFRRCTATHGQRLAGGIHSVLNRNSVTRRRIVDPQLQR